MAVYFDNSYQTYSSTFGVVLTSGTSGSNGLITNGGELIVPSQSAVWAIWTPGTACGVSRAAVEKGAGAGGYETYYLQSGKK